MAKVKRRKASEKVSTKPQPEKKALAVSLPTVKSKPSSRLQDYSILLYGEKKIGKTSLSSWFNRTMFLMLEPGGKALSIYQKSVNTWDEFKQYVQLLKRSKDFDTVVIDPVDHAYKLCLNHVCNEMVIDHPSDEEWGKGWKAVKDEFTDQINLLLNLGKGVIFISHAVEKEIKTRTGNKYDKIMPTMSSQARDILEGVVDIWVYYCYEGDRRVLYLIGDDLIGAGHRLEDRFRYTNGNAIKSIDAGKSAKEAHARFIKAFDNEMVEKGTSTKKKLIIKKGR